MVARRLVAGPPLAERRVRPAQPLYTHLQRLSFSFYDRNQTGQLMSRATARRRRRAHVPRLRADVHHAVRASRSRLGVLLLSRAGCWRWSRSCCCRRSSTSRPATRAARTRAQGRPAARRRRHDAGRGGRSSACAWSRPSRRRSARPQRFPRAPSASSSASSTPRAARVYRRCSRSCRSSPSRVYPALGGLLVIDGRLTLGDFVALQPLARDAGLAAAHARHVGRPGPARRRLRRAHVRDARRRARASPTRRDPKPLPERRRRDPLRGRDVRLRRRPAGRCATSTSTIPAGRRSR